MRENKIEKQVYIKPKLIEIGKMQIITKDNSGSLATDNVGMPTHMSMV